jgi:hypothetical protein
MERSSRSSRFEALSSVVKVVEMCCSREIESEEARLVSLVQLCAVCLRV